MFSYVIRRIVFGLAVLLGTSLITFVIAFVIPADPAVAVAGAKADPATLAAIRTQLGLDQPIYLQYGRYVGRALHGDLGRSYIRREDVARLILSRFPATAILAVTAMLLSLALGIPMAMLAPATTRASCRPISPPRWIRNTSAPHAARACRCAPRCSNTRWPTRCSR
jgi:peptide/nickel transport system permease protein